MDGLPASRIPGRSVRSLAGGLLKTAGTYKTMSEIVLRSLFILCDLVLVTFVHQHHRKITWECLFLIASRFANPLEASPSPIGCTTRVVSLTLFTTAIREFNILPAGLNLGRLVRRSMSTDLARESKFHRGEGRRSDVYLYCLAFAGRSRECRSRIMP